MCALIGCALPACITENQRPTAEQRVAGERLAQAHCGSCHRYPDPSLLDAERWRGVLPHMAHRLGVYHRVGRDSLIGQTDLRGVDTTTVFPERPLVTDAEWEALEAFYLTTAPDTLARIRRTRPLRSGLAHFVPRVPRRRLGMPLTLLTKIQPDERVFFVGHYGYRRPSTLEMIDASGRVVTEWRMRDAPVRVHEGSGGRYVLLIGPGPEPTEASVGSLVMIGEGQAAPRTLVSGLKRPVDLEVVDVNGDGLDDFVICEYGHASGSLSLYVAEGRGAYRREVLSAEPGAIQAVIHDFDRNGTPDVGVLMAQGDEAFDVYLNDGDGGFVRRRQLRFPPVYGSNDIQLADFDADGRMDLLYVNGDNADYTEVTKPYHGVRLFLADEQGGYREALFFPLPGAYAARAGDFDADGDLDIAAVAYFPDYREAPDEGFIYLENRGDLTFDGYTLADARRGRWITMDAGDLDGDGDLDLLLGSNIGFSPKGDTTGLFQRWIDEGTPFVVLENTLR